MTETQLDVSALYAALDSSRKKRGISWRSLADEANVSASTLTRMKTHGRRPDVDTLAALVSWLGVPAERFIRTREGGGSRSGHRRPETVATITAALRADRELTENDAKYIQEALEAAFRFIQSTKQKG